MACNRIQTGQTEPIEVLIVDSFNKPLTGLTNIKVKIRRISDGLFYDWSINDFSATPAQLLQILEEVDVTRFPGEYRLNSSPHVLGFNTLAIASKNDDDVYRITVIQDGSPLTTSNVPQIGELKEGDFIDLIDQAISDNASPNEVKAELVAIGLDHLISVNPGVVPPAANTYIRQILDKVNASQTHSIEMNFSYNPVNDTLTGNVWVESANLVVSDPGELSLTLHDDEGTQIFGPLTDDTPDPHGVFKVSITPTSFSSGKGFYAKSIVTLPLGDTISGIKGMFTV